VLLLPYKNGKEKLQKISDVYKNCAIRVVLDGKELMTLKKQIVAPGEMEQVVIKKEQLLAYPDLKQITIKIEEA